MYLKDLIKNLVIISEVAALLLAAEQTLPGGSKHEEDITNEQFDQLCAAYARILDNRKKK